MGCKSSKPTKESADAHPVERFLESVLNPYYVFLRQSDEPVEAHGPLLRIFINTLTDVVRSNYRVKIEVAISAVKQQAKETGEACLMQAAEEIIQRAADAGHASLLTAWIVHNPSFEPTVPAAKARLILRDTGVFFDGTNQLTFGEIVSQFYSWHKKDAIMPVFRQYSKNGVTISPVEYGEFLSSCQKLPQNNAAELMRTRLGGIICCRNFANYYTNVQTSGALDPLRAQSVWQDMTQPLPSYSIRTESIFSEQDLTQALANGCRAFIIHPKLVQSGIVIGDNLLFRRLLETLKGRAFLTNTYPVVLCFSPKVALSVSFQKLLAAELDEVLGSVLARGLMFEGANLNDPRFTPAALQKKVLVLASQATVHPFVGFHVSDMNRVGLGVRVRDVQQNTPAAKAGIQKDDWLTHMNDVAIEDKADLKARLGALRLGEQFTMKKENLSEMHLVVGGTIDADDEQHAKEFSDLVFLSYAENSKRCAPWDVEVVETTHALHEVAKTATKPCKHFLIFDTHSLSDSERQAFVTEADEAGIQFIDIGQSPETVFWALGRFSDNANCGYILCDVEHESTHKRVTLTVLGQPQIVPSDAVLTLTKETIYGDCHSSDSSSTTNSTISVEIQRGNSVLVVELEYRTKTAEKMTFLASIPPHLLREGYHALPVIASSGSDWLLNQNRVFAVLCRIELQGVQ